MGWLDRIPYTILVPFAVILAIMPLGAPHLVEKLRMLFAGTLRRPLDWFDLVMHGAPLLLLVAKLIVTARR
ncbi:MAG TPA: RND transporter [Thermoanaerobaculia bacterium]|nr:RND transporter [Thermoanaerobaculia bacterium]